MQEIKCVDEAFPREFEFEELGYNVAVHGQKGFNGVALLSKLPFDDVTPRLAGDESDVQARYLEACVSVPSGVLARHQHLSAERQSGRDREVRLQARLDEPLARAHQDAARERGADDHRRRLQRHPDGRRTSTIPQPGSTMRCSSRKPRAFPRARSISASPARFARATTSRTATRSGTIRPAPSRRTKGLRIDHLLLSPQAADRLVTCEIDASPRAWEKPSDHVPIWLELNI